MRTSISVAEGTPPGKATAWVRDRSNLIYGYFQYDSAEAALSDITALLKDAGPTARMVYINYKAPDDSYLDVYVLEAFRLQKRVPWNPGPIWDWVCGLFRRGRCVKQQLSVIGFIKSIKQGT